MSESPDFIEDAEYDDDLINDHEANSLGDIA